MNEFLDKSAHPALEGRTPEETPDCSGVWQDAGANPGLARAMYTLQQDGARLAGRAHWREGRRARVGVVRGRVGLDGLAIWAVYALGSQAVGAGFDERLALARVIGFFEGRSFRGKVAVYDGHKLVAVASQRLTPLEPAAEA